MPKYFHHFLPLYPPVPLGELANVTSLHEIEFRTKTGHSMVIRLLGRPHTIDVIAVSAGTDVPSEKRSEWIKLIGNHMIAVLRVTYDVNADVIRNQDGIFNLCTESDDPVPDYTVAIEAGVHLDHIIDVNNIGGVFCSTMTPEKMPIMALLAEAQTPSIPVHYKILSLIRALEIMLPADKDRYEWLDRYEGPFSALNVSKRPFRNALHELRTKCAHGVSRGDGKPFVEQAYDAIPGMVPLLQLLRTVVGDQVRIRYDIQLRTMAETQLIPNGDKSLFA